VGHGDLPPRAALRSTARRDGVTIIGELDAGARDRRLRHAHESAIATITAKQLGGRDMYRLVVIAQR